MLSSQVCLVTTCSAMQLTNTMVKGEDHCYAMLDTITIQVCRATTVANFETNYEIFICFVDNLCQEISFLSQKRCGHALVVVVVGCLLQYNNNC